MVLSARFELATSWFEARRSIQMSYESIFDIIAKIDPIFQQKVGPLTTVEGYCPVFTELTNGLAAGWASG